MLTNMPIAPQTLAEVVNGTAASTNSALVYIHGYNTSFEDALYRAAQLSYDTGFDGAAFLYSWPSAARVTQYLADVANAEWSGGHLQEFLDLLGSRCDFDSIHFIAHGLGVIPLMNGLQRMKVTNPSSCPIGEIVLVAPDIGADVFDHLCPIVRPLARGITVYSSRDDKVLKVAASLSSSPRAGEMTVDGPTIGTCADVIDTTRVDDGLSLGHSYVGGGGGEVLRDLAQLLASGTRPPPEQRYGLMAIKGPRGIYWKMYDPNHS
jgi:esterase/lipase superfamily enzyme